MAILSYEEWKVQRGLNTAQTYNTYQRGTPEFEQQLRFGYSQYLSSQSGGYTGTATYNLFTGVSETKVVAPQGVVFTNEMGQVIPTTGGEEVTIIRKQNVGPEKQPSLWLGGTTEYLKQNPPNFVTTQDRESSNTSTTQEQDGFTRALIPTPEPTPNNLMLPDVTDVAAGSVYTITKWLTGSRTSAQAMYDLTQGIGLSIGTTRKEFTPEGYIIDYLPSPDNQDAFTFGRIIGIPISMGITENVGSFFADYAIQPIEAQTIQINEGAYTISSTAVRTGGGEIVTKSFQRLLSSEGNKFVYTSAISDLAKSGRSITIGYSNPPSLTTYSYTKGSVSEGLLTTKSGEWLDFAKGTLTNRGYRYPISIISTSANNLRSVSSISGTLPIISGSPTLSASKISGLTSGVQSISEAISSTKVGSNLISSLKFMAGLGSAAKISPIRTSTISMPTTKLYTPPATLSPTISRSRISSIPQQTFKPPTTKSISTTKTISIPVTKPVTIPITKTSAPPMPRSIPSGIRVPIRLPSVVNITNIESPTGVNTGYRFPSAVDYPFEKSGFNVNVDKVVNVNEVGYGYSYGYGYNNVNFNTPNINLSLPLFPRLNFGSGLLGKGWGSKGFGVGSRYTPSFAGIAGGFTSRKQPKGFGGFFSGGEIRPVISNRKKKRSKN